MAHKIVSLYAAYRSRGEVVDGFLARPLKHKPVPALVLLHGYRGVDDAHRAITRKFAGEGFVPRSGGAQGDSGSASVPLRHGGCQHHQGGNREALTRYGKKFEIYIYEGAGHAFLNNFSRKNEADRKAADKAFSKASKWLRKTLA